MPQPETTKESSGEPWSRSQWFIEILGTMHWAPVVLLLGLGQLTSSYLLYVLLLYLVLLGALLASYQSRNRQEANQLFQRYLWIVGVVYFGGLVYLQFFGTDQVRNLVDLSPWTWASLAVPPLLSLQFWLGNRTTSRSSQ